MEAANQSETTTARLRGQLSAKGIIDAAPITAQLMRLQENGVASVEHLTDTFSKLVPILHGNADEALFFVERLADLEAATGIGADGMAQLLMMIEQSGELESKTAKKLERAGIPIWKELAAVYDMSIDEVKALSKAHKIGVDEIKQALKNATKMYAGTAAALSGTTQGSKDSMDAAKKLAYMPAADAFNDLMREHYQERQAEFDAMASDKAWRQDMELIGNAEAQLSLLWDAIGELGESISNGALQCVANVIDYFKGWTTAGEIEARRINGGRDNLERLSANMPNFDAQTAQNAFDALDKTLLKENAKLSEYIENKDLSSGAERD